MKRARSVTSGIALAVAAAHFAWAVRSTAADATPVSSAAPATSASAVANASASAAPTPSASTASSAPHAPSSIPHPATPSAAKIADSAGTRVTITSSNLDTWIYLAKGDVPEGAVPDPFERIGVAPLEILLAPGVYTIESGNPTSSTGHTRFRVEQGQALAIEIRNGDSMVKTLGAVFIATGIVAILLGVLTIVSIAPHDESFHRYTIGVPLLAGGAISSAVGIGLTFAGATTFKMPTSNQATMGGITLSF